MKAIRLIHLIIPLAFLSTGCSDDDLRSGVQEGGPIKFDICFSPVTRVATDAAFRSTWQSGDEIGIFAVTSGQSLSSTATDNYLHNIRLTYTETTPGDPATGSWSPDNGVVLLWPSGAGASLDFYAYYPYSIAMSDPNNYTFAVMTNQGGVTGSRSNYDLSDMLRARATAVVNSGNAVQLQFSHMLSMIQVEIVTTGGVTIDPASMSARLWSVQPGATFSGWDNAPVVSATATDITMHRVADMTDTYRAIIPPQTLGEYVEITFVQNTAGNEIYMRYADVAGQTLAAGRTYKYRVTIQ